MGFALYKPLNAKFKLSAGEHISPPSDGSFAAVPCFQSRALRGQDWVELNRGMERQGEDDVPVPHSVSA